MPKKIYDLPVFYNSLWYMISPAVNRKILPVVAGFVWTAVGLALCAVAVHWLIQAKDIWLPPVAVGLVAGVVIYRFGFLRLVLKNKTRLHSWPIPKNKICLFAFQSWRSYVIIVIMAGLGFGLRHLPISRIYLAPIYLAIGTGLFLASLHYYPQGAGPEKNI